MMAGICAECGCICAQCTKKTAEKQHIDMHLHAEIENLRQRLMERDSHIVTIETQFLNEADKFPNGELASAKEDLRIWQEKYSRLCDAHNRVQKVNQNLEDKLLRIVDKCQTEKGAFAKDIATLSHRLADANYTIHRLTRDNEKYRNDVNLAIQLLQCKPSNFVGQKYDSLPSEVQAKVRTYVAQKRRSSSDACASPPDVKSITVPISTFPPTAMVYSITKASIEKHSDDDDDDESDDSKPPVDIVSAAIMAKVLEDRERERIFAKHCNTCSCHRTILMVDSETQTSLDVCRGSCDSTELSNDLERSVYDLINVTQNDNHSRINNSSNVNAKIYYGTVNNSRQTGIVAASQNHKSSQIINNDRLTMSKPNIKHKPKQSRLSKRIEPDTTRTSRGNYNWTKYDLTANNCVDDNAMQQNGASATAADEKEKKPIDIINDIIWKSEWSKSQGNAMASGEITNDNRKKRESETQIDVVINERAWKKETCATNENKRQMTLIQVASAVPSLPKDCQQSETAVSPSFSTASDSVVISTSNKSSSSSDALHTMNDNTPIRMHNNNTQSNNNNNNKNNENNNSKSICKERTTGPRNCFMRLTPGSKNILLDNVGHYQTVLYTSGGNRPNTALVHIAKSTRSARSMSTSSEENSPLVTTTNDSTQLQRVAEWVQSSVVPTKTPIATVEKSINGGDGDGDDDTLVKIDIDDSVASLQEIVVEQHISEKSPENPFGDGVAHSSFSNKNQQISQNVIPEDLITFETPGTDDKVTTVQNTNYEVKITKEMEEIYLKLAASLDPVSLKLSTSSNTDLTIEKYRKDHRRIHLQKLAEKRE